MSKQRVKIHENNLPSQLFLKLFLLGMSAAIAIAAIVIWALMIK